MELNVAGNPWQNHRGFIMHTQSEDTTGKGRLRADYIHLSKMWALRGEAGSSPRLACMRGEHAGICRQSGNH